MSDRKAYLGINLKTNVADVICSQDYPKDQLANEMEGLLVVLLPIEQAKELWSTVVEDPFALAASR